MKKILLFLVLFLGSGFLFYFESYFELQEIDTLAIYINKEEVFDMPKKDSGLTLSNESRCNNGVTIRWDDDKWISKVNYENYINTGERTRCELYFEEKILSPIRTIGSNDKNGLWEYKENITKLIIQDKLEEIPNSLKTTDESELQDKSIMSYVILNVDNTTYTAYLQSDEKLYLNPNSSYLFCGFTKLETIEGMEYLETKNVTSMSYFFWKCSNLANLDLQYFNTSNVTSMVYMFRDCNNLVSLDLSSFDTKNVANMTCMFFNCTQLAHLNFDGWDTINVTDMSSMFVGCVNLVNLDVSNFNTSNVTNMSHMFEGCRSITSLDLSNFDTSKVTDMSVMFSTCTSLKNLNISSFDTNFVINIGSMFYNCSNLNSIFFGTNFVYKNNAVTTNMFYNCPANKPSHSSWNGVTF